MKRIFTLSVLLVVSGLLLPACGTHMTIAKRQHSKGYYVDISSDKKHAKTDAKIVRELEENQETITYNRNNGKPIAPKHVVKKVSAAEETAVAETQTEAATEVVAVEEQTALAEKPLNIPAEKSALQTEKSGAKTLKSVVKQEVKKFTQSSKVKKMESKRTDGLSLFWIVILILLILWLLGLLGGLGWFIHIALVVALILLILWLIGII